MPEIEDAGFEVPPAPWEFGGEAGGEVGSETGGGGSGSDGLGVAGADIGQTDSGDTGGYDQGAGYAAMRDQYNDAGIGAGGTGQTDSGDTGGYDQGAGYAEMRDQYNEAGIGGGGSAAGDYSQGEGYAEMRNQYNAAGIGAGGSAPDDYSQGEGWNIMRDQYNAADIGAGGSAASDISQGEGWKIMRDQYNAAGVGASGTAPEPRNRWDAATLPNLLAWGAGYGNAIGQTPQEMTKWINQSIQQWNSAHPDNQYPLLPPVVGPKMPVQPIDKKLTQTDVPWYDPMSGRWIQPGSVVPDVNNPLGGTNPSGHSTPEDLWASVQHLWRMLNDRGYARSQACGLNIDPNCGRTSVSPSVSGLLETGDEFAQERFKYNFGPPITNPETLKAIKLAAELGQWLPKNEGMSESAETYQAYVAGTTGEVFTYNDYDFDGFNGNALLDAKDRYKQFIDPSTGDWQWWFSGAEGMVDDARKQVAAAQGAPIEWHFNEKGPADRVRKLFSDEGIEGIEVTYDPMPADWGK